MLDPVTNRYAEALFNLAKRDGVLDAVRRDVESLTLVDEIEFGGLVTAVSFVDDDRQLAVSTRAGAQLDRRRALKVETSGRQRPRSRDSNEARRSL